ncbi:MAG: NAD(P)H-dependent oxidoreductase, partial [Actinomycetota bacterium]
MTEQLQSMTESQKGSAAPASYDDLKVLLLNCTLTRSPNLSHTEGLMQVARGIFEANGVEVEYLRPVDCEIPAGLKHDYAGRDGYERDDWPSIQAKIDACDILIIGTSVWLGEKSSVCNRVLERMYGYTHDLN